MAIGCYRVFCLLAGLLFALSAHAFGEPLSEEFVIDRWEQASEPQDAHRRLEAFVGTWRLRTRVKILPESRAEELSGTAEIDWVLGKRFLRLSIHAGGIAGDYEAMAMIGYDNVKQQYVASWADNKSSGILIEEGVFDDRLKQFVLEGRVHSPVSGQSEKVKIRWTILDQEQLLFELLSHRPKTEQFYTMIEARYFRK